MKSRQKNRGEDMDEKSIKLSANDRLGIVVALLKTINMAIDNTDYFGEDGQSVAITLDIANTELNECRKLLESSEIYTAGNV